MVKPIHYYIPTPAREATPEEIAAAQERLERYFNTPPEERTKLNLSPKLLALIEEEEKAEQAQWMKEINSCPQD